MDEQYNSTPKQDETPQDEQTVELGFIDRMIGVVAAPRETLYNMAALETKTSHWFMPIILLALSLCIYTATLQLVPEQRSILREKQRSKTEQVLKKAMEDKKITEEQAEAQMKMVDKQTEMIGTPIGIGIACITIFIFIFLALVVISGYFYFIVTFFMKGTFAYKDMLSIYSVISIIAIFEVLGCLLFSLLTGQQVNDLSIASIIGMQELSIGKYILARLDIFSLWQFTLISFGIAAYNKTTNIKKYAILVFGSWIFWSFVWFMLSKSFPFLAGN
ncbi:MAG: hypothetical protein LWX56_03050 [Ignavibacteria bacterium]|nr:hypothetical protein [Ignavibacteria bacterium]